MFFLRAKDRLMSWTASLPKDEEEKVQMKRKRHERKRRSSEWRLNREGGSRPMRSLHP